MSEFTASDHRHMARALQLAERGLYTTDPNPRVGCVIARDDELLGEGFHARAGQPHAEIHALRDAAERGHRQAQLEQASAYVTLEPCSHHGRTPPCSAALAEAGIGRVVAAMRDPDPRVAGGGLEYLRERGVAVHTGLLEPAARELNRGFVARMTRGRPWLRVKLAASLDGRTAMASGQSQWITGEAARRDVQLLRARAGCVLTGSATQRADDPALNLRLGADELGIDGEPRQPLRALIDGKLGVDPQAQMLNLPGERLVFTASREVMKINLLRQRGVDVCQLPSVAGRVDLQAVLAELARREINEVQVEAGATLSGALLEAGLVDEIVVYLAPLLMGDAARGLFRLPAIREMAERLPLRLVDLRRVGDDVRLELRSGRE